MVKKLTKHGNSLALIIDPAEPSARRKKFEAARKFVHENYADVFKKLAE